MEKYKSIITTAIFILYIIFSGIFIYNFLKYGMQAEMKDISKLITNISPEILLTIISLIITVIGLLVEYVIAKFLLLIFVPSIKPNFIYVISPKLIAILLNTILITLFNVDTKVIFLTITLLGSLGIFFIFFSKKKSLMATILFSAPFILDAAIALIKEIKVTM